MTLRLPLSWTNRRLSRYCFSRVSDAMEQSCEGLKLQVEFSLPIEARINRIRVITHLLELRLCGCHLEL